MVFFRVQFSQQNQSSVQVHPWEPWPRGPRLSKEDFHQAAVEAAAALRGIFGLRFFGHSDAVYE